MEDDGASGAALDLLHDVVPVRIGVRKRQENLERHGGQWKERLGRALGCHELIAIPAASSSIAATDRNLSTRIQASGNYTPCAYIRPKHIDGREREVAVQVRGAPKSGPPPGERSEPSGARAWGWGPTRN
jgi:hypothetical protein